MICPAESELAVAKSLSRLVQPALQAVRFSYDVISDQLQNFEGKWLAAERGVRIGQGRVVIKHFLRGAALLAVVQTQAVQITVFDLPQAGRYAPTQSVASTLQGGQIGQFAQFGWNLPDEIIA